MVTIPFGLSVHHFVSSVGADVGFASLIGLALLVLLFFSQARETATLRARADETSLRIQELEGELADMAEQVAALPAEISVRAASPRAAAAFGAVQPGVAAAAGGTRGATMPPAAPAGVAAPALAAATRLIPGPEPLPAYEPATAANGNGAARPAVAASAGTVERPVQARTASAPRPVAAPPRVGVGGGPGGRGPGAGPARPGGPGQGRPAGAGQGRPPGAGQARYAGPSRPSGAPMRPPARRSRGRIVFGVLLGVAALAAVAVGVIALTGGGKTPSSASHSSSTATLSSHRTTPSSGLVAVQPSTVTVSVLNGTDMQGLAGRVAQQLAGVGYRKGSVTNASDQTQAKTVVAYMTAADRADALAVAQALKLSKASVQPVDPNTKAIVCPPSQACTSMVVVIAGQDLAAQ